MHEKSINNVQKCPLATTVQYMTQINLESLLRPSYLTHTRYIHAFRPVCSCYNRAYHLFLTYENLCKQEWVTPSPEFVYHIRSVLRHQFPGLRAHIQMPDDHHECLVSFYTTLYEFVIRLNAKFQCHVLHAKGI